MLVEKVQKAIDDAENFKSGIGVDAFSVCGLTGMKVRHLLNNLCKGETNYFEIGSFKGATMVAALSNNPEAKGTFIEAFMEEYFGTTGKDYLANNIQRVLGDDHNVVGIIGDCYVDGSVEKAKAHAPYDIFLYDGNHGETETAEALNLYLPMMKDEFVLIMDDWCTPGMDVGVRAGTYKILSNKKYTVLEDWERWTLQGGEDDLHSGWWNGLYIAVVKKNEA